MISPETFRLMALELEGVTESPHFDRTSFRVNKKIFSTLHEESNTGMLKFSLVDQSVFCDADPAFYPVPNKWGTQGFTFIDLKEVDGDLLREAMFTSYRFILSSKKK